MRGNCGGSFRRGLPQALEDDDGGLYIMGYRVAPDSGENFSELKIRSCPVADVNRLAPIIQIYNRLKGGLVRLNDLYLKPSCALIETIDIIHASVEEAQRRATERAMNKHD